ncbi:basic blue protein-like [Phragmites australis]|uniref:basic blue protein-like n=1 Tax=Phragmites australis TaxID=29695 RepID=UPI002D79F770|nr:basic blue protein-like [Phragmites australis]
MARRSSKILVVFLCVMVFAQREEGGGGMVAAESRLWPVGDHAGWSFGVLGWPNYKPFKTGDVLLFSYKPGEHNVMQVSSLQYALCEAPGNATVWSTGNDRITLARGVSFFISGFTGDCEKGMKIAVTAR